MTSAQTWNLWGHQPPDVTPPGAFLTRSTGARSDIAQPDIGYPGNGESGNWRSGNGMRAETATPGLVAAADDHGAWSGAGPSSGAGWGLDIDSADVGQSAGRHRRVVLSPVLESARLARDFTRTTLLDWQLDALACEAVTIASELVTNAIKHGISLATAGSDRSGVGLAWQRHASRLVCVVTDPSACPPVLAISGSDAESGRGLHVVQALAIAWGWMMLNAQEKAVWAALLLPVGG